MWVGVIGDMVTVHERAVRVALATDRAVVLDGERQAFEATGGAARIASLRLLGELQRLVEIAIREGVDRWLDRLRAGDEGMHQLARRQSARCEALQGLGRGEIT